MEEFNVARLVCSTAPSTGPLAVLLAVAGNRNHDNAVAVFPGEIGVRVDVGIRILSGGIKAPRANDRCFVDRDGSCVQWATWVWGVPVRRVSDVVARRGGNCYVGTARVVTRLFLELRRRRVLGVEVSAVGIARGGICAHAPLACYTVGVARPAVVGLRRCPVFVEGVGFEDVSGRVGEYHRLPHRLRHLEIRIQVASDVEVLGNLALVGADDQQVTARRDGRPRGDFEHLGIVGIVGQPVPVEVNCRRSLVVEFDVILIVAVYAQRVVAGRKLIDDHLRRGRRSNQTHKGDKKRDVQEVLTHH